METHSIWTGLRRGLAGRCPVCGEGRLFEGFLKLPAHCPVCGADNGIYPADDMPPYLTILVVGHIVVPLFMWSDHAMMPPMWLQFVVWPSLTVGLCLLLLPRMKGAVVGACWALALRRGDPVR